MLMRRRRKKDQGDDDGFRRVPKSYRAQAPMRRAPIARRPKASARRRMPKRKVNYPRGKGSNKFPGLGRKNNY